MWTQRHHPVLLTISHKWIAPKVQRREQAARDALYAAVRALTMQWHMARERKIRLDIAKHSC